jgi:predicted RNase H-like HicB family nuclease
MVETLSRRRSYKVVYELEPDGSAWNVSVPELPGVYTWASSVRKAREHAREAIALWLDIDQSAVPIEEEEYVLPARFRSALERARRSRERSDAAQRDATTAARDAARVLTESAGLTLRDAGEVLGVSYQRVDQLLKGGRPTKRAS